MQNNRGLAFPDLILQRLFKVYASMKGDLAYSATCTAYHARASRHTTLSVPWRPSQKLSRLPSRPPDGTQLSPTRRNRLPSSDACEIGRPKTWRSSFRSSAALSPGRARHAKLTTSSASSALQVGSQKRGWRDHGAAAKPSPIPLTGALQPRLPSATGVTASSC